jgi:hypothetical protein
MATPTATTSRAHRTKRPTPALRPHTQVGSAFPVKTTSNLMEKMPGRAVKIVWPLFIALIVIPIVAGVLALWWRRKSKLRSTELEKLTDESRATIQDEIDKRRKEYEDASSGTPIWFSRRVKHGSLHHWVLYIGAMKYELRRDHATSRYKYNRAPARIDEEQRAAYLTSSGIPAVTLGEHNYWICLIGWTKKNDDELHDIAMETFESFGEYSLLYNNCQKFLKKFADTIETKPATDWPWFYDNVSTRHQDVVTLKPPKAAIWAMDALVLEQLKKTPGRLMEEVPITALGAVIAINV